MRFQIFSTVIVVCFSMVTSIAQPHNIDRIEPTAICKMSTIYLDQYGSTSSGNMKSIYKDDFESYDAGEKIAWPHNSEWATWNTDEKRSAGVSTMRAFSGEKSLAIADKSDFIKFLGNKSTGQYMIQSKLYIPKGSEAYFNIQNSEKPGKQWNLEIQFAHDEYGSFPLANEIGIVYDSYGEYPYDHKGLENPIGQSFNYKNDVWMDFVLLFNLDKNAVSIYLDGEKIYHQVDLDNENLGSLNFYKDQSTPSFYIDDFNYVELSTTKKSLNDNTSFDADSKVVAFTMEQVYTCDEIGTNNVRLYVVDEYCNMSSCLAKVIVKDNQAPVFEHKDDIIVEANSIDKTYAYDFSISAEDNCSEKVEITSNYTFGHALPLGTNQLNYTAKDESGNVATKNYSVTVVENHKSLIEANNAVKVNGDEDEIAKLVDMSSITLFPNPTTEYATLDISLTKVIEVKIEMVDINGRIVKDFNSYSTSNISTKLDVRSLSAGSYFINVKLDKEKLVLPLVITK